MKEWFDIAQWALTTLPAHPVGHDRNLPRPVFTTRDGREGVSFSTNNYLGLSFHPSVIAKAKVGLQSEGLGNCESRLLGGDIPVYAQIERKLAEIKKKESAILFATGYLANVGVLSIIPNVQKIARGFSYPSETIHSYAYFCDELNHISLQEGAKNSRTERVTYAHCNMEVLETHLARSKADNKIIVTDGVFSQDGDIAPLPEIIRLADKYDAYVYIDDAHGTGVLGATGGGITEHFGLYSHRILHMGTLSKAYGAIGGFVAGSAIFTEVLRHACPAYGFTSTIPPDQAYGVLEAIEIASRDHNRRERLWDNQRYLVGRMKNLPYTLISTDTPIVPLMIGDEETAERFSSGLQERGLHVETARFPAVKRNEARLRIQLSAEHTHEHIDRLVKALDELHELLPRREVVAGYSIRKRGAAELAGAEPPPSL